jgi:hypothetical protein
VLRGIRLVQTAPQVGQASYRHSSILLRYSS